MEQLLNVLVEFLPKRTRSFLPSLDLAVIASLKDQYDRKVMRGAAGLGDRGKTEYLYRINLKLAGLWTVDIWERLENGIVYNCWEKSTISSACKF